LVQRLQAARRDLRLPQRLAKLDRFDLIILDDLSYVRRDQAETAVLFELISKRHERKSIAITANAPFSQWSDVFVDPAPTLAAIDRLVHHAAILEMNVERCRQLKTGPQVFECDGSPQHELRERRKVLWFVKAELVAAREFERRHQTPAAVGERCRFDSLLLELLYRRGDVAADQPQFVFGVVFGLMDGEFGRRCGEEEPPVAGVDVVQVEHVLEKVIHLLGVLCVEDRVDTGDHSVPLPSNYAPSLRSARMTLQRRFARSARDDHSVIEKRAAPLWTAWLSSASSS
jgi:hypothetical protein